MLVDKKDDQITDAYLEFILLAGWLTGLLSLVVKSYSLGRIDSSP